MQTDPINHYLTLFRTLDIHTHGTKSLQGRKTVFAFEETLDMCYTVRERTQHDRTMRNRFISWHAQRPLQDTAWRYGKHNIFFSGWV